MTTVKGPLVYAEWREHDHGKNGEHALSLNIDFYCPPYYSCVLVNKKGHDVKGNKVEIKKTKPKGANAEAIVFYKILKDLSREIELETIILQEDKGGQWEDYTVKGNPSLHEVRLDIYDWVKYQAHHRHQVMVGQLEQHEFGGEKYIKLAELEAAIDEYSYAPEIHEALMGLHQDLPVYAFVGEEYLKLEDLNAVYRHIPRHVVVIIGSGG